MLNYSFFRNAHLSIIDSLRDVLPSSVPVVDETEEDLQTATVGIYPGSVVYKAFELGNSADSDILGWFAAVYGNTPMERDMLAITVYNTLKNWVVPVKDFTNSEAPLGTLYIGDILNISIDRAPKDQIEKLRYFAVISFQTTYQEA